MEVFTRWHSWDTVRADIAASGAPVDVDALGAAVAAARQWHGDQKRPTGAPYVEHLLEALEVLVRGAGVTTPAVLTAAILHDVVEDTPATLADVEAEFGAEVAELVDWVTKPPAAGAGRQAKRAAKAAYLRRLGDAPAEAVQVKLADRVSNVQTLGDMPPDFQRRYYAETLTYIVPLTAPHPWFRAWYASWRTEYAHLL
ncbi:HD domain-containing protein [Actinomadura latina]|uniref:Bifunctional (P)ppGpp synthetase/guanosine-3',5'-bis(Diphosphate) 3'-pyrophosphohydrolase n=1 Tax=Actinomadura latina TaxID=163603 RepID=A0A846Z848_9ACTN|nr:HD domain-containing protein [Actinomadura latina]NKZ07382.1 bifunctional (p)ppGpp synthetase/guanosine-3',5'-bis(diphosphate) 3'-pyrophosphohydrolase [Actinomadura latina]